jgi:hypothetical protein
LVSIEASGDPLQPLELKLQLKTKVERPGYDAVITDQEHQPYASVVVPALQSPH